MFVVVEGLTGSGKSTVTNLLVEEFGFERVVVKRQALEEALRAVEDDLTALEVRHALFWSATLWSGLDVERALAADQPVVSDSWVYRTIATHEALGSRLTTPIPAFLPKPNFTILLEVDESVRKARTAARGRPNGHWKQQCEAHSEEIIAWYRQNVPNLRTVKNSGDLHALRTQLAAEIADFADE